MKYPKLRELKEAIRSLFSMAATTRFPYEPHEPFDGIRGKPEYFEEHCVGCGACAEVCPSGAITISDPEYTQKKNQTYMRRLELHYDTCIFCGTCEANCITKMGVQLTKNFDLALFDRTLAVESIEKELVYCDLCNSVITTKDHLKWTFKKLGALAYGNPNLLLMNQRELMPVNSGKAGDDLRRPDIFKVLCPKCRHEVMLKDIWG